MSTKEANLIESICDIRFDIVVEFLDSYFSLRPVFERMEGTSEFREVGDNYVICFRFLPQNKKYLTKFYLMPDGYFSAKITSHCIYKTHEVEKTWFSMCMVANNDVIENSDNIREIIFKQMSRNELTTPSVEVEKSEKPEKPEKPKEIKESEFEVDLLKLDHNWIIAEIRLTISKRIARESMAGFIKSFRQLDIKNYSLL